MGASVVSATAAGTPTGQEIAGVARLGMAIQATVGEVIRGKPDAVRLAVIALLAEGHVLVEDVPGLGKTSLARALAASIGGRMGRIQFTPDLLPADVTGGLVYRQDEGTFDFRQGPIFAHIVLADEINRASPKTQSALLEVMAERQVTVDRSTHPVPLPFSVLATQNPVEMDGTYRLPEAQLDRFMMRLSIGYPSRETEVDILRGSATRSPERLRPVAGPDAVLWAVGIVKRIDVHDALYGYIADLCAATRKATDLRLGASPRAGIALLAAARACAVLEGRAYVIPEDLALLAQPVLAHRMIATPGALREGRDPAVALRDVLATLPMPGPGTVRPAAG